MRPSWRPSGIRCGLSRTTSTAAGRPAKPPATRP
uniref:Uncharacterized protein n=1 Tax=Macrostomum lignano TaxID=282301 RepID=A0A1I8IPH8_9PLAT